MSTKVLGDLLVCTKTLADAFEKKTEFCPMRCVVHYIHRAPISLHGSLYDKESKTTLTMLTCAEAFVKNLVLYIIWNAATIIGKSEDRLGRVA